MTFELYPIYSNVFLFDKEEEYCSYFIHDLSKTPSVYTQLIPLIF